MSLIHDLWRADMQVSQFLDALLRPRNTVSTQALPLLLGLNHPVQPSLVPAQSFDGRETKTQVGSYIYHSFYSI